MGKEDQPQPQNQPKLFFDIDDFEGQKLTELNDRQQQKLRASIIYGLGENKDEVEAFYRNKNTNYSDITLEELFPHYLQARYFKSVYSFWYVAHYMHVNGKKPTRVHVEEFLSQFNFSAIDAYEDLTSADE